MSEPLTFLPEYIPEALKALPQWVGWKYGEPRPDGKRPKPPVDIHGRKIDPHDPANWLEFSEALAALEEEGSLFEGLGFVLTENDAYTCGDLDDCIDDQGKPNVEAQAILDQFNSYSELSPSGKGLHIWVKGKLAKACKQGHVEVYDRARYGLKWLPAQ